MDDELQTLRELLTSHRPGGVAPHQGAEAFMQHKLMASTIHQATRLDARAAESETGGWVRYFTSYFPEPRNTESDARILWTDWRTSLLKDGAPGPAILLTHGQPAIHWQRDSLLRLCIDLESMWADFDASLDTFLNTPESSPDRRAVVLQRAERSQVTVEIVQITGIGAPASGWVPGVSLTPPIPPGGSVIGRIS